MVPARPFFVGKLGAVEHLDVRFFVDREPRAPARFASAVTRKSGE
jgi:hypothetical protein